MKRRLPFLFLGVAFLSIWGCSRLKVGSFVMPSWDTQFSAPIFNRAYTLQEILSKDSAMVSNGDTTYLRAVGATGVFSIFKTQGLSGTSVGNNLKIASIPQTTEARSPSDFTIDAPPAIHYSEVNPALPVGSTTPVPAIPQRKTNITPDSPFTNFQSATISSGTFTLTAYNGYPATMQFPNGIDLTDGSGNLIITIPIDSLVSYRAESVAVSLAGVVMPNNPQVSFTYASNGSTAPATFQSDTLIALSIELTNVKVSSADAIVPPQPPITLDRGLMLPDGNKVATASISSGVLNISVTNAFDMSIPISLTIKSLVGQSGPLSRTFTLASAGSSGSTYQESIPLSGYVLNMADASGSPGDSLMYSVVAQVPGSNGQFINIATSDSVKAAFGLSGLQFSSFTGEVHMTGPVSIPADTQTVNLGDFTSMFNGRILFSDSTKLVLNINMTGGFPSLVHLKLIPSSTSTGPVTGDSLVVEKMLYPGQPNYITLGQNFVSVLNTFTSTTNEIPDQFIISGYVVVNPGPPYAMGTVKQTDVVEGTATIEIPFDLGISNATFTDTTKTPVINDSSTASRLDNVDSGQVVIEVNNGLPVQMSLITQLIDTVTHQVVMTLPSDSIVIPAANDFNSDGTVRTPMFSSNKFTLTHDQAVELGRSYMKFSFRVATSPNRQTVPFTKNNTISLKVSANLAFRVDKNLVGK